MDRLARLADAALAIVIGVGLAAAILLQLLGLTGRSAVVITGGSMEPAIPIGSLVLIEPISAAAPLAVGDVVTMRVGAARAAVSHRVIRLVDRDGAAWLETRGDANLDPDPVLVPMSAIIGRASLAWPGLGRWLGAFTTSAGFRTIVGLCGALYAVSLLLRRLVRAPRTLVVVDRVRLVSRLDLVVGSHRPIVIVDRIPHGPIR